MSNVEGRKQAPDLSGPRGRGRKDTSMTAAAIVASLRMIQAKELFLPGSALLKVPFVPRSAFKESVDFD
jgi:hypothetical protein